MNKLNLAQLAKNVKASMTRHSPELLTGIGIAGMIATTVLAVRATPKALRLIENAEQKHDEPLTKVETVKACWKCYIPAAVTGVSSVACLIGASSVSAQRNAALTAAYTLSDTALREYREKVVETIGEKKEQAVRDAVAKDRVEKNPASSSEVIVTGTGNTQCYDWYTSRHFKADIDKLKSAVNDLNSQMLDEGHVCLNDFYYLVNLPNAGVGDDLGWSYNRDGLVKLNLSSQLDEGVPCIVVDFQVAPHYDYDAY